MSDRTVRLDVQKNGNMNKIVTKEASLGELGQLSQRIRFNRFGEAREIDATIIVTSPIPADLMGAVAEVESEQ